MPPAVRLSHGPRKLFLHDDLESFTVTSTITALSSTHQRSVQHKKTFYTNSRRLFNTTTNHVAHQLRISSIQPCRIRQEPDQARGRRPECAPASRGTYICTIFCHLWAPSLTPLPEIERALLRALRTKARFLSLIRRIDLLHPLHGKVHGCLEHRLEAVRRPDTEGCGR